MSVPMIIAFGVWVGMAGIYTPPAPMQAVSVSGVVTVIITASDATPDPMDVESGISWVEFWADSTLVKRFTAQPYTTSWDSNTLTNGAHTLMAKASDNAGNVGTASLPVNITNNGDTTAPALTLAVQTGGPNPKSIWANSTTPAGHTADTRGLELGVKFRSDTSGVITAIKFYKDVENTGAHTVSLWTVSGILLNWAVATSETPTGWQTINLPSPVSITAGVTYIASVHASSGYSYTCPYFTVTYDNPPLHALADGGMVAVGSQSTFPTGTYNTCNWWVDVVFQ